MTSSKAPKRLVFVVGAGASRTYGLPTGDELKQQLVNHCPTVYANDRFADDPVSCGAVQHGFREFSRELAEARQVSLDAFLARRPQYRLPGTQAMAHVLLNAQERSIRERTGQDRDWLAWLFQHFLNTYPAPPRCQVRFITFNYDCLLDIHLATMIKHSYGATWDDAANWQRDHAPIRHVYGCLQFKDTYGTVRPAGWHDGKLERVSDALVGLAAQQLRIISDERQDSSPAVSDARNWIATASRIFCLGIAYDDTNLRRIGMHADDPDWKQ